MEDGVKFQMINVQYTTKEILFLSNNLNVHLFLPLDQRLDLCKLNPSDSDTIRGQIVGKH